MLVYAVWLLANGNVYGGFATYLIVLIAVGLISLAFDFSDTKKWLGGDRRVAGC